MRGRPASLPDSMASESWSMDAICAADQKRAMVLGAHAGKFEQVEDAGAVFRHKLVAQRHGAGGGDGLEVCGHALADAGNLKQARGVGGDGGNVDGGLLDGLGGAAIAADAEAVGAVDLHEVGGFGQQMSDGGVVQSESPRRNRLREQYLRCDRGKPRWEGQDVIQKLDTHTKHRATVQGGITTRSAYELRDR